MRPILLILWAGALCAQEDPVFRAGVSLVHVDAEVTEEGRLIDGLHQYDFQVKDEGSVQMVRQFSAGEQSLDLVLLFDVSGSMRPALSRVAAAARQALNELRQGDRVAVMTFSFGSRVLLPFTGDLAAVDRTIREDVMGTKFGGGTLIQNAMASAARYFMPEPRNERRRAVLIITDNEGQRTRTTLSVAREFWEADAILSGLIVGSPIATGVGAAGPIMAPQLVLMRVGIRGVADRTGGDAIRANDPGEGFRDMMHRIRSRYSLYYSLPVAKRGTTRTIRVTLAGEAEARYPKARVRARAGYVVPAPAGSTAPKKGRHGR